MFQVNLQIKVVHYDYDYENVPIQSVYDDYDIL